MPIPLSFTAGCFCGAQAVTHLIVVTVKSYTSYNEVFSSRMAACFIRIREQITHMCERGDNTTRLASGCARNQGGAITAQDGLTRMQYGFIVERMPYTVLVGGVSIQCETAAEAVELARQAGGEQQPHAVKGSHDKTAAVTGSRWTEQRVREFFRVIKERQRKLIDALLETPDAVTDDQLCKQLGLADGRSLAGVFTGLWKNAKKVGADPKELYKRNGITIGDKRQFEYTLAESFRQAAKKWKP